MSTTSKIDWTDATWNVTSGCTKVSPGCANCYAERMHKRLRAMGQARYAAPFSQVVCHPDALDAPLHWRKPRRIFVNSMADLFHEDVPFAFVEAVTTVIAACSARTFQILTKRPERMREFFRRIPQIWPLPNLWLGVTAENQEAADERIPLLLQTPAAVRFVSYEPALGPVDLRAVSTANVSAAAGNKLSDCLHWVIAGGESGPHARPMHPNWVRSIRDQCAGAGVPFFFKGWGEHGTCWATMPHMIADELYPSEPTWKMFTSYEQWIAKARGWLKRGDICLDLDGKQLHCGGDFMRATYPVAIMTPMAKAKSGHLLDGREHHEFPTPRPRL